MAKARPPHGTRLALAASALAALLTLATAQNPLTSIVVDGSSNRQSINPFIYGVSYASAAQLSDLNVPLNRMGGNPTSRYNWAQNADNRANDWYFESIPYTSSVTGEGGDSFISASLSSGAQPMLTVPLLPWVAKVGPKRQKLASFSQAKYGAQQSSDIWFPDAGNGVLASTGAFVTGNNPNDANVPSNSTFQQQWVQHIVSKWGRAAAGGLKYYLMDNEPSIWFSTHRDVFPNGPTMADVKNRTLDYAAKIKAVDPTALVVGPEEWGWNGYFYSGADQQYASLHNWNGVHPDRAANGNMDYLPWLLSQLNQAQQSTGQRLLDVFSVHFYPQGGESSSATDTATKLLRNRSTRQLWDPNYVSESWINAKVDLIARLKGWVNAYYPGTKVALTEYSWGADADMNGATAQADVLGIFGTQGMDMAARWTCPNTTTPTYQAFKVFRNYDGSKSTFGDVSVSTSVPNPDQMSAFVALRSSDKALTLVVINKVLSGNTPISITLGNVAVGGTAQVWQLSGAGTSIVRQADASISSGLLSASVPPSSVTLFVIAASGTPIPLPSPTPAPLPSPPVPVPSPTPIVKPTFNSSAVASPSATAVGTPVTISVSVTCTAGSLTAGIVDLEVYSSSGAKVFQAYTNPSTAPQSFHTGTTNAYTWTWTPAATGAFTVEIGVFTGTWSANYAWNGAAATVTVSSAPPPTPPPSPTHTPSPLHVPYSPLPVPSSPVPVPSSPIRVPSSLLSSGPPTFTSATVAFPTSAVVGSAVKITATVTCTGGSLTNGMIGLQVYSSSRAQVFESYTDPSTSPQNFSPGTMRTYTWTWTPAAAGTYTVKIGVFSGTWTANYAWNGAAATVTVAPASFATSAVATPSSVAVGKAVSVAVNVTLAGGSASSCIVDFEMYDQSGNKVNQSTKSGQSFATGIAKSYTFSWVPTAKGIYTVKLGVFSSDWSVEYVWNNGAATITAT